MVYTPESVTTGADLLVELVDTHKQISVADAAKELKVPAVTVEAWATFLEEEGMMEIRYSFTKPILASVGQGKTKKKKSKYDKKFDHSSYNAKDTGPELTSRVEIASIEPDLIQQTKDIDTVGELLRNGDFNGLRQVFVAFEISALSMQKLIVPRIQQLHPDTAEEIYADITEFRAMLKTALALIEHQHFDQAKHQFQAMSLKAVEIIRLVRSAHAYLQQETKPKETPSQQNLLDHAYDLLKKGNVQAAKAEFTELTDRYEHMPEDFERKQKTMQRQLTKLSLDMSSAEERTAKEHFSVAKKRIEQYLKQGKKFVKESKFKNGFGLYAEMRATFKALPPGFEKEHEALQQKIVKFYGELSKSHQMHSNNLFIQETKSIEAMLLDLNKLVNTKKTDEGLKLYNLIQQMFSTLPDGFLKEKLAMHSTILEAYEKLAQQYHGYTVDRMHSGRKAILHLIEQVNAAINSGSTASAQDSYRKANSLFDQLPAGFLKERTDLKTRLLETYEDLLIHSDESAFRSLKQELQTIEGYITQIQTHLKTNQYREAEQQYHQAMMHFNSLPGGFLQHKRVVRQKLLDLYRKIILHQDKRVLNNMTEEHTKTYNKILVMLTDVHHRVAEKEFEALDKNLPIIKKLVDGLPKDFDKANGKLQQQLMIAMDAYQLYQATKELDRLEEEKDYHGLEIGVQKLAKETQELGTKTHDYDELKKYSEEKQAVLLTIIKNRKELTTKPKNLPQHKGITKPRKTYHRAQPAPPPSHVVIHEKIKQLHYAARPKVKAP